MFGRSTNRPNALSVWSKHSTRRSKAGGSIPWSRPCRRYVGCRSPERLRPWLNSETSSAERRHQGSITKAGKTHARRALVEGAWAYRDPAKVSRPLHLRLATPSKAVQDSSWKAQARLCTRDRRLMARGKHANQVVVAMANQVTVTP